MRRVHSPSYILSCKFLPRFIRDVGMPVKGRRSEMYLDGIRVDKILVREFADIRSDSRFRGL